MASNEENDEVAAYLARERAALGKSSSLHSLHVSLNRSLTGTHYQSSGEDADLFASGGAALDSTAPAAPSSGLDEFADFGSAPAAETDDTSAPSAPSGIDAFPSLDMMDSPSAGGSRGGIQEVRVTGHAGTGDEGDEEREKFESAFPDIQSEQVEAIAPSVRTLRATLFAVYSTHV